MGLMQDLPSEHVNMGPVLGSASLHDSIWKKMGESDGRYIKWGALGLLFCQQAAEHY